MGMERFSSNKVKLSQRLYYLVKVVIFLLVGLIIYYCIKHPSEDLVLRIFEPIESITKPIWLPVQHLENVVFEKINAFMNKNGGRAFFWIFLVIITYVELFFFAMGFRCINIAKINLKKAINEKKPKSKIIYWSCYSLITLFSLVFAIYVLVRSCLTISKIIGV